MANQFHKGFPGMLQSKPSRLGSLLLLLAAVIGFAVALYAWLTPLTGVTGTIGALGVAIANVVLALLTFLLRGASGRAARITLIILTLVVLFGIGFAAALLHQYIITAAMVVGLVGLITLNNNSVRHNHRVKA
jgi:chromate transport protein ChrA